MNYLLDTSTIIDLIRKKNTVIAFIQKHENDRFTTSSICVYELWSGVFRFKSKEQDFQKKQLTNLLESFAEIIPFSSEQAAIAGSLYADLSHKGALIDDIDILIAAACIESQTTLVTGNAKHFTRIPGLTVITI
jgi:predicted nucleic acid-binding protein